MVENIKKPFLVVDKGCNLITCNKEAVAVFGIGSVSVNLLHYFEQNCGSKFAITIKEIYDSDISFDERLNFKLKNGFDFYAKTHIIPSYVDDNQKFLLIMLIPENQSGLLKEYLRMVVSYEELPKKVNNKNIVRLIEEIKTIYPFTFIGKQKIQTEIDELEEMFWIMDPNSDYVIVNSNFAKSFGLKPAYFTGKNQKEFVPAFMLEFYESIQNFIKNNLNMIILEGLPFNGINITENSQIIEIPIGDLENNLIATIGLVQKKGIEDEILFDKGKEEIVKGLIKNLPLPLAVIDISGKIKQYNEQFGSALSIGPNNENVISIRHLFDGDVCERIESFNISRSQYYSIDGVRIIFDKNGEEKKIKLILNRFSEDSFLKDEVSLIIEDKSYDDELENLIKGRGKMFDILVKNSPEPIFIYDTENLRFLEVNDAAVKLYGFKRDEFLQMDLTDLYTPEDIQTLLDASNQEGVFSGPWRHRKKDGSSVYVELSKHSFKYNNTNAHFNFVRDVTEKLELERDNKLFKTVFENSTDLLIVTDNNGFIIRTNNVAQSFLGYSADEINNTTFAALVRDEERGHINGLIFQKNTVESQKIKIELKNREGVYSGFDLMAIPILNYQEEIEAINLIIAPEKEKEEVVKEVIKEVVKEVIVETKNGAGGSTNMNPQFFSNVFHEILTPINVILGFVQEINESIEEPNDEQKEAVDIINQNRQKLLQTMNSIAEFSELEQSSLELKKQEIQITEIIDGMQEDDVIAKNNFKLSFGKISSSLKFVSDKYKFQTFVNSFVKISYGLARQSKIFLSAQPYGHDSFSISVKDNASVISEELLKYLQMLFERNDLSVSRDFGISKMLIRLTKRLIEILCGKPIVIEKGGTAVEFAFIFPNELTSSVEITIPDKEPEAVIEPLSVIEPTPAVVPVVVAAPEPIIQAPIEEIPPVEQPEETLVVVKNEPEKKFEKFEKERIDLSKYSCLYIEDQVDSQILFKVQLKDLKEIKFAVSFEEALPLLNSMKFDFVVMDINLQGEYNGLDALKIIHRMAGFETLPIIAVTAYVLPGDREKFIAAGFFDFCAKPLFREKMIDVLEKLF
jgi:PAS domain S-box-containing protein